MDIGTWKEITRSQFGAAIDMLENAIKLCPEDLWADRSKKHELWYMAHHTLFWLDLYLYGSIEGFRPPEPFGLEELDPKGVLPERVYSKTELLSYLKYCRKRCRQSLAELTEDSARRLCKFGRREISYAELLLYNLRHVQHHTAQLNLLMRLAIDKAPRWVGRSQTLDP